MYARTPTPKQMPRSIYCFSWYGIVVPAPLRRWPCTVSSEILHLCVLAEDAALRNSVVRSKDFVCLAGLWDVRFRRHFQQQLRQPVHTHQVWRQSTLLIRSLDQQPGLSIDCPCTLAALLTCYILSWRRVWTHSELSCMFNLMSACSHPAQQQVSLWMGLSCCMFAGYPFEYPPCTRGRQRGITAHK